MSRLIQKNNQFLLKAQLDARETTRYIQARIYDSSMNEVGFSPVLLVHKANGLYYNIANQATTIGNYTVQYSVYKDVGLTNLDTYGTTEEDVLVFDFDQNILTAVQAIPTNPLLTNDSRLDNLAQIPNKLDTTAFTTGKSEIINTLSDTIDQSDGRAV